MVKYILFLIPNLLRKLHYLNVFDTKTTKHDTTPTLVNGLAHQTRYDIHIMVINALCMYCVYDMYVTKSVSMHIISCIRPPSM